MAGTIDTSSESLIGVSRFLRNRMSSSLAKMLTNLRTAPLSSQQFQGETWPWYATKDLPAELPIDMLVIDGPPQATGPHARYLAGPVLFPRLSPGAVVYLDDAARSDEQAILRRWRGEFPSLRQSQLACEKGCARLVNESLAAEAPPALALPQAILAPQH